eukprot:5560009-Pyramimonas_sp.AAC.1
MPGRQRWIRHSGNPCQETPCLPPGSPGFPGFRWFCYGGRLTFPQQKPMDVLGSQGLGSTRRCCGASSNDDVDADSDAADDDDAAAADDDDDANDGDDD